MSDVLERARKELVATSERIANFETSMAMEMESHKIKLAAMQTGQDGDVQRQVQLEEYIKRHEALVAEAASLLIDVLPSPSAEKSPAKQAPGAGRRFGKRPTGEIGIADIRAKVYPILQQRGVMEFGSSHIRDVMTELGMDEGVDKIGIAAWIISDTKRKGTTVTKTGPGTFAFVQ